MHPASLNLGVRPLTQSCEKLRPEHHGIRGLARIVPAYVLLVDKSLEEIHCDRMFFALVCRSVASPAANSELQQCATWEMDVRELARAADAVALLEVR